jgi:hypothetical protein
VTETQKKLSAVIAVGIMSGLAAVAVIFALAAATGKLVGKTLLADLFISLCSSIADLKIMLGGLGVLVLGGAGYFGAKCTSRRQWVIVVSLLALGILSCIALMLCFSDADLVGNIYQPSLVGNYGNNESFLNDAKPLVTGIGVALVSGLSAFLGFSPREQEKQ